MSASNCLAQAGNDIVPWQKNLDEAMQLAKDQNKPLLLHFWAPTCGPCLKLDKTVFSKNSVAQTLNDYFVPVKIDGSAQPALRAAYRVDQYPTDVIVLPSNEVVHRMVTPQSAEQYIHQLAAIAFRTGIVAKKETAKDRYATENKFANQGPNAVRDRYQIDDRNDALGSTQSQLPNRDLPAKPDNRFDKYREQYGNYAEDVLATNDRDRDRDREPQNTTRGNRQREVRNPYAGQSHSQDKTPSQNNRYASQQTQTDTVTPPQSTVAQRRSPTNIQRYASADTRRPAPAHQPPRERDEVKPSMDGYCPVTLVRNEAWKKGNPSLGAIHRGRLFLFVGEKEKRAFLAAPDKFSPVLAGVDLVELTDNGRVLEGHRAHGVVFREQVFLFINEQNLIRFWDAPDRYKTKILQAMQTPKGDSRYR
ncbi:DUF255 domain-containing protein [Planctomycetota bacterium]